MSRLTRYRSESSSNASGGGIDFCGDLTILFIGLKLVRVIDWTWTWVLSPLWIPPVVIFGGLGIFAVGFGIWYLLALLVNVIQKYRCERKVKSSDT